MASKARFGRLPRSAPSLTATIVALGQEYQRVRESNILGAWKNGGLFEGKKVTDQMVLKWLKDRRDGMSRDDPMWDYYNNQLGEYQFSIQNSKMELAYAQHKVGDRGMVAFYHTWANKLPANSEAYRAREKLAAAYADRAASAGRAGSQAAADRAYAHSIGQNYKNEFAYDTVTFFLTNEARRRGILGPNEDLSNIDPSEADGARIDALWDEIATSDDYADEREFYKDQIEKVTGKPFGGDFSKDAYSGYTRTKKANVNDRVQKAVKGDHRGDVTTFKNDRTKVRGTDVIVAGFDETVAYEESRQEWEDVFTDPASSLLAKDRANKKYIGDLEKIRDGLKATLRPDENDPRLGWVENELLTMNGDEHPLDHWGGMAGVGKANTGGGDATETATGVNALKNMLDLLDDRDANGEPLFVMTKVLNGVPVNTNATNHASLAWSVVAVGSMDPNSIYVVTDDEQDPRSGRIITAVSPTPVYIQSDVTKWNDDGTQTTKTQQADKPSAFMFTLPDGSTGYKYQDGEGKWLFTPTNPFGQQTLDPKTNQMHYQDTEISVGGKEATVTVAGDGMHVAGNASAMKPELYNPNQNNNMPGNVVKSGYALMLLATNPKNNIAYTQKPDDIFAALKLESGNDVAALQEKIVDADHQRSVYLGNSNAEQQRIRAAAMTGAPLPVPLSAVMTREGITSQSEEALDIQRLVGGKTKDEISQDIREGNRQDRPFTLGDSTPSTNRKYDFVRPTAPLPNGMTESPTSLGSSFAPAISATLGNMIAQNTGPATPRPQGDHAASLVGGYNAVPAAPAATAPPKPTTPKPVEETKPVDRTTPTPTPVQQYKNTPTNPRYGGLGAS